MSRSMHGPAFRPRGRSADVDWARELAALGPKRLTVLVDVSNQCNIRCRMCYFSFDSVFHRTAVHMRPDAYRTLAAELLPNARILYLSAGNEPLVSPHFEEILRITSEYELDDVKFLTNGLLLGPAIAETILATNVTQVHLSIDGATRETYEWVRRGGCFDTFVENVRHLARRKVELGRERPCLQFNITLMRANLEELPRFVDLAEELGVTRIACRHLMPYSGLDIEDQVLSNEKVAANRGLERMLERVMRSDTVELVNFPDLFSAAEPAAAAPEPRPAPDAVEATEIPTAPRVRVIFRPHRAPCPPRSI